MSLDSASQLLVAAQKSGLLSRADADQFAAELESSKVESAKEAGATLVGQRKLTHFQVEKLLEGHGDDCVLAGRYHLLEKLGEGGMGAVFKALDARLDRPVAIKVLPPHSLNDSEAIARFEREAKALAKLSHPNIIQAYDVGEDRGRHFVVMEYIEGRNLHRVLQERGPLSAARAADYICQAALGLHHAHEKGLVHRDLKPSNLIVTADRKIKIVDLGLARFFQDHIGNPGLTHDGMGLGTPDYMPPEQFHDARTADPRADIYSLGCTFYHLLVGEVPFPGSSLSEKCRAHEERPPPLELKCPDVPTGIQEILARMMAKQPEARYPSALDVALALGPHVAGASASSVQIRATASWTAGRMLPKKPRRLPWPAAVISGAVGAVVLAAALLIVPRLLPPAGVTVKNENVINPDNAPPGDADEKPETPISPESPRSASTDAKEDNSTKPAATNPNLLTVSKDPAGGGQFRSIGAALEKARPGVTIRVLGNEEYSERISLTGRARFANLTLEALEGAVLSVDTSGQTAVLINGVPGVTIRGFHLRADAPNTSLIFVTGPSPGVLIDGIQSGPNQGERHDAIQIGDLELANEDAPLVIRNCTLRRPEQGIAVQGGSTDTSSASSARIVIRENRILGATGRALWLLGRLRQVQVVGNRIEGGALYGAVQFQHLKDAEDLLIANNTFFAPSTTAIRLWDSGVNAKGVEIRNNLVLDAVSIDMSYIDSGGSAALPRGPGDVKELQNRWQFSHNWREVTPPRGAGVLERSWIPPGSKCKVQSPIEVLSRSPDDSNFLQPAADSPLANGGAGVEQSDLPKYVGAIPPEGMKPWDWQQTWDSRHKYSITVSKDGQGEVRTIGEALNKVRPGGSIHVLDDARYEEALLIKRTTALAGVSLIAKNGATLAPPAGEKLGILIDGVPGVRIAGFQMVASAKEQYLIAVANNTPGLVIEDIIFHGGTAQKEYCAVGLQGVNQVGDKEPVTVRNCVMHQPKIGVRLSGTGDIALIVFPYPCRRVVVRDNLILDPGDGIVALGCLQNVMLVGNRISGAQDVGIQIENVLPRTRSLLIANNSLLNCAFGITLQDDHAKNFFGDDVEILNNLILLSPGGPIAVLKPPGFAEIIRKPGDGTLLGKHWRLAYNGRVGPAPDEKSEYRPALAPAADSDFVADNLEFMSRTPSDGNFLRPPAGSPLGSKGAGQESESLPNYLGALPPAGAEPWEWETTWKARATAK